MPVFIVRGMDGQVGIVAARNTVDAVERLDEFANFEGCPIRQLPDVMLLLDVDDDGEMALRQLGEEMEGSIRRFAYPLLERLVRSGQFEDQQLTRKAVSAERERVRRKSTAQPLTGRGREIKQQTDLPSSLIRKYEQQVTGAMLRRQKVPSHPRKRH
jgi:hypothetical protein